MAQISIDIHNKKMNNKDYIFLNDYFNYGCKNHVLTALALSKAISQAKEIAQEYYQKLEYLTLEDPKIKSERLNEKAAVQSIMLAKLYTEYAAAIEDFGALLYAIKNRNKSSIFEEYINSEVRQVADFFDNILNKNLKLNELLNIPSIMELTKLIDNSLLNYIKKCYEEYPNLIREIARVYRYKSILQSYIKDPSELPKDYNNYLYIILGLRNCKKNEKEKSLMTKTFNKIKHRFMVIGNIYNFLKAEPSYTLNYTFHKIQPEWTEQLLTSIVSIEKYTRSIINLIIALKDNNINI